MSPEGRYKEFVSEKMNGNYESPLQGTVASTILGSDNFIETVRKKYIKGIKCSNIDRNLPAIRELKSTPDINELCGLIESLIDTDATATLSRNVALYLCHKYSGRTLKEIGNYFGIRESAVSQSSRRFSHRFDKDKKLKKKVNAAPALPLRFLVN